MRAFNLFIFLILTFAFKACSDSAENFDQTSQGNTNANMEDFDFDAMMEEFNNRPILEILTEKVIDSASNDNLVQLVFDTLSLKVENNFENSQRIISNLSEGRQAIYSIYLVEGEVNNGGFNQFYTNSSSEFSEMAVAGFDLIGAIEYAELMKLANMTYKEQELAERQDGTIEGFSASYEDNPLNDLDLKFYDMTEDLSALQIHFIRKNKAQFID